MVKEAHHNVLNQLVVMEPFVDKNLEEIHATCDGQRTEAWVQKQHKAKFTVWIKELQDIPHGDSDEARLAFGSSTQITTWQWYEINGYIFHTKEKDKKSTTQNSGVQYEGIDDSTGLTSTYFGQIEDIWELDYGGELQLAVFRCQWVKLSTKASRQSTLGYAHGSSLSVDGAQATNLMVTQDTDKVFIQVRPPYGRNTYVLRLIVLLWIVLS